MPSPNANIVRWSKTGRSPCIITLLCSFVVSAAFLAVGVVCVAFPLWGQYLLYPCLVEIEDNATSLPSTRPSPDATRLAGACFLVISVSSMGLLVPLLPRCQHGKSEGCDSNEYVSSNYFHAVFMQGSMGLSLVGVGLINLSTSEDDNGYVGEYSCALKDQSTLLWTGVGVLVLTSFGLMASFWPDSREDESSNGQPPHAPYQRRLWHCCRRKTKSPIYGAIMDDCENATVTNVYDIDDYENSTVENVDDMDDCDNSTVTDVGERRESTSRQRGTSRLLKLAGNQSVYLWVGIVVLLARLPFSLAIPHFVSTTIAKLISEDFIGARREILLLLLLGTVDAVLDFWCVFLFGKAKENIVRAVRVDTFSSIIRQDQSFFDTTNTGDLISRLTSDCGEMAQDLTWFFRFSVEAVVRITGIGVYMVLRSPILGACTLGIVPVVGLINKFYSSWLAKNAIKVQNALADATSCAHESLSCIKTVIMLASEDDECEKYKNRVEKLYDLNIQQLIATGFYFMAVSTFLINTCVQGSLLLLGSIFVQQGKLTAEILLAFMLYQGQLQEWSLNLFQSYSSLVKSSGAGDRVFFLLDRHPPPPGTGNSLVKSLETKFENAMTKEDITIDNVTFSYPSRPDTFALDKISLKIKSGSLVALVGHSGCGKSTIVSLLQRIYDPNEGTIKFGDVDLRNMSLKSHRSKLGVVTQDPVLFSGTIEENIRYGSSATFEEILMVSSIANAHSFIEQFPNKYKEQVGERGLSLSGGQRQRIAIARALARKPALLLLDEATSALDPESEAAVQEALNELLQNRFGMTTIIIAHRLQTVRSADTIFVMKNGSLVEQGSHDQLLQYGSGHYRRMLDRVDSAGLFP